MSMARKEAEANLGSQNEKLKLNIDNLKNQIKTKTRYQNVIYYAWLVINMM